MSLAQRHARRLRLVAGSEEAARAAVPRLEDALRCASLPDAGSRLLLVRRLALGRLPRQASSQAIARLIEARFADGGARWTEGATDDRSGAERIVFASAWHARVALAGRLLRGEPASAWYWPLAVPEFRAGIAAGDNLRAIARTLAQSAEARVALPAWAVHVVRAGGAQRLAALIPERFGEALLREAGLPLPVVGQGRANAADASAARSSAASGGTHSDRRRIASMPPWLQGLLQAGAGSDADTGMALPRARRASPRANAAQADRRDGVEDRAVPEAGPPVRPAREALAPRTPRQEAAPETGPVSTPRPVVASSMARDAPAVGAASASREARIDSSVAALGAATEGGELADSGSGPLSTAFAGLPFLLPVLAHLGLPRWVEAEPGAGDPADWARAVLAAALVRLRAPRDDPAWAIAMPATPLLADGRRADEQVGHWLTTVRRWLRREARIGLASLVRRPGRLGLTPTHLDMHFALTAVDLRVRRLGLDIDPGWLPWFGRVVCFHYEEQPP
ncbi:hypothetical protein [Variovorax saccharolyticus]|uniref:hypothetical protein n=1 Tax=Variovorax saccharolyticus TaxID=3053516 RepID=UPI002578700A|nr:hypothetical protein [Variovorax sp. J22R187]MDM0018101.1 hypothetical protein [Variovorax sp. J22R187]